MILKTIGVDCPWLFTTFKPIWTSPVIIVFQHDCYYQLNRADYYADN